MVAQAKKKPKLVNMVNIYTMEIFIHLVLLSFEKKLLSHFLVQQMERSSFAKVRHSNLLLPSLCASYCKTVTVLN